MKWVSNITVERLCLDIEARFSILFPKDVPFMSSLTAFEWTKEGRLRFIDKLLEVGVKYPNR